MGIGQTTIYPSTDGHAGHLGKNTDLEASSQTLLLFLEHGGDRAGW